MKKSEALVDDDLVNEHQEQRLRQRVRSIEATIDAHLKWLLFIKIGSEEKSNTAYYKYYKDSYKQKLLLLMANNEKIKQACAAVRGEISRA